MCSRSLKLDNRLLMAGGLILSFVAFSFSLDDQLGGYQQGLSQALVLSQVGLGSCIYVLYIDMNWQNLHTL